MKQMKMIYACLIALTSTAVFGNSSCQFEKASPYFSIRSQSVDSARDLVGLANDLHIHRYDMCDMYGNFAVTAEYAKSFNSKNIARCLFGDGLSTTGDCNGPTIKISGSHVQDRGVRDWLADYFGLPTDFQSTLTFSPSVKTFLVDFDLFLGLDECMEGMYLRIHAPFVHTQWSLGYCEDVLKAGVNSYDAGYFANAVDRSKLLNSFQDYVSCGKVPELNCGVFYEPLRFSKWAVSDCRDSLKANRLSEIQVVLGSDWWQCEDYHFGFNIRGSIPTGTRPRGEYLFEPVVGNGHHFELGGGLTGHYTFYRDCECDRSAGVWFDLNVTHLFSTRQCRNFDLCQSPNSRYMLAERLGKPVENDLEGNPDVATVSQQGDNPTVFPPMDGYTLADYQFKKIFTPVANLTQSRVKVSVPIQVDLSVLFNYSCSCYSFDFGYNLWTRSCEKIKFDCACPSPLEGHAWALKGDAHVFGYQAQCINQVTEIGEKVALSATQHSANIYAGTNRPCGEALDTKQQQRNPGVDNTEFAYSVVGNFRLPLISSNTLMDLSNDPNCYNVFSNGNETGIQTRTSIQPIFLSTADIDCDGARTKGTSHKIFGHVSYTWGETECGYLPYIGVGAKAEFAQRNDDCCDGAKTCFTTATCDPCDSSCRRCAISEWGVWIKGGVSFD